MSREAILPGVRAALADVLEETIWDVDIYYKLGSRVNPESGIVDWGAIPSAPIRATFEQQVLAHLSVRLNAYLSSGGAIDEDSAEEEDDWESGGEDGNWIGEDGKDDMGRRAPWEDCAQGASPFT